MPTKMGNHALMLLGDLLIIHGTGDDNVHYRGTEMLINELIAHNKPFTMMAYPNRSHSLSEGPGTTRHFHELLTRYPGTFAGKTGFTSIGEQVVIQAKGVLLTVVWSAVVAYVSYKIVDMTIGLRVPEEQEREGLDISSHGESAYRT